MWSRIKEAVEEVHSRRTQRMKKTRHACFVTSCSLDQNLEKSGLNVPVAKNGHTTCSTYDEEAEKAYVCVTSAQE
jgi:hypothetical protein